MVGRRGFVDAAADPLLPLPQGPAAFAQRVEMVFLIGECGVALSLAFLLHPSQALGQAGAAIAGQLLQVRQAAEFFRPGIAVAVVGQPSREPTQAVLLHDHQTRSAAKEDFIGSDLLDPRPGDRVEDGQQRRGALGGGVGPASQLGNARRPLPKQRPQQPLGDGQADAFRLGRGGETGEVVGIEDHGLLELSLDEFSVSAEAVVIVLQALKPLAFVRAFNGLKDFGSVAVEGLAGSVGEGGLSGDGPVGAVQNSGGVGDAELGR